jgi:hypothetical protein
MFKEMLIKTALNARFGRYGKLLKLQIDSSSKTMDVERMLKGETQAITIHVGRYEIRREGREGILLSDIQTSRDWLTELAAAMGPEIFIPVERARLLGLVL